SEATQFRSRRYYNEELQRLLSCGIAVPNMPAPEMICPVYALNLPWQRERDTALVFAKMLVRARIEALQVNLGPPPFPEQPVTVAGFVDTEKRGTAMRTDGAVVLPMPVRRPIVRVGRYLGYERNTPGAAKERLLHTMPVDFGMSGGPMMIDRQDADG